MWIAIGVIAVIIIIILVEFRSRKPDRIILYESKGRVKPYQRRFYPRHFCLSIPAKLKSSILEVDAEAKGKLRVDLRLSITVAPSLNHLPELVRAGGWDQKAVDIASQELEVVLNALVREFVEKHEIDELTGETLSAHLRQNIKTMINSLGLEAVAINVQSIEPTDANISEALRKREAARILEETEAINQKARITATRAKNEADKKVARYDHELALHKMELQQNENEKEDRLAEQRVTEELKRRKMQLEVDSAEMNLLKKNPELLLLTPQMARLAEAGQALRNARTIVSLSPEEFASQGPIGKILQKLVRELKASDPSHPDPEEQ